LLRYQFGFFYQNLPIPVSSTNLVEVYVSVKTKFPFTGIATAFKRTEHRLKINILPSLMQNYNNHTRYYPLHHFILTPLTAIILIWTVIRFFSAVGTENGIQEALLHFLMALVLAILPLLSRIYALKNQNRIIRLEMRLRYFNLSGNPFSAIERKLLISQIVALRFASDDELLPLIDKTIQNQLSSKEIKKSIKNWQEDRNRV
jgi:hypothetical protein